MDLNKTPAYELVSKKELNDIRSTGYLLRHKKTGARVMLIENDDENKVFQHCIPYSAEKQHWSGTYSGTQCTLRIQGISSQGSFRRTGKRFPEYLSKCDDISGQDLLSGSKL